jgi:hypothetical protein
MPLYLEHNFSNALRGQGAPFCFVKPCSTFSLCSHLSYGSLPRTICIRGCAATSYPDYGLEEALHDQDAKPVACCVCLALDLLASPCLSYCSP